MALDFPASPALNQTYTGQDGTIWLWDGAKWVPGTAQAGVYAPLASPVFTGNPQAPTPAAGDSDTSLATTAFVSAAIAPYGNSGGRNLIHNPLFTISQRTGPFTGTATTAYTLDRWNLTTGGGFDAITQTQMAASDADRTGIGDEAVRFTLNNVFTGSANAGASSYTEQRIENVRRLSGKTVTISFWAVGSATLNFGINAFQIFGSGGSPSTFVQVLTTGMAVGVTTAWARYSVTFAMPSTAGKTFGTNNDDSTWLRFYFSSGATNNAAAGNIGVQSGTLRLWGVQLEIGSVATSLEKPDPQQDLANCQRFYQTGWMYAQTNLVSGSFGTSNQFVVWMRAGPTVAISSNSNTNLTGFTAAANGPMGFYGTGNVTASGNTIINVTITASADL